MYTFVTCLAGILIVWLAVESIAATVFIRVLRRGLRTEVRRVGDWPKAGILLSLRGADEETEESLVRLLAQDYPNYELHVVVDSEQDSAWKVVQKVIREHPSSRVFVQTLTRRPSTCSLHCASLIQAAESARTCEVLALADGDVVAFPDWLRSLVVALDDPQVGIAGGNRWYLPADGGWGSLVRYLWNVPSVAVMYFFGMPWGGSCAMRRGDFERAQIAETWRTTLNQDHPARICIRQIHKKIGFVPNLIMPSRDTISLPVCTQFVTRQLLWARLYSPLPVWIAILVHGWGTALAYLSLVPLLVIAVINGDSTLALTASAIIAVYTVVTLTIVMMMDVTMRSVIRRQGNDAPGMTPINFLRLIVALGLTQIVYFMVLWPATFIDRITWRGVAYEIRGPWNNRVMSETGNEMDTELVANKVWAGSTTSSGGG